MNFKYIIIYDNNNILSQMYVPKEIHENILSFVDNYDKVYCAFVCPLWRDILEDNFNKNVSATDFPIENPYNLNLWFKKYNYDKAIRNSFKRDILKKFRDEIHENINVSILNILTQQHFYINNILIKKKCVINPNEDYFLSKYITKNILNKYTKYLVKYIIMNNISWLESYNYYHKNNDVMKYIQNKIKKHHNNK